MKTLELIKYLKGMPETGTVYICGDGGPLLEALPPHPASPLEKQNAGIAQEQNVIIVRGKVDLLGS
jgi:hypothetical protein